MTFIIQMNKMKKDQFGYEKVGGLYERLTINPKHICKFSK